MGREKRTPAIIAQRKFELIKRDPLAIEFDELLRGIRKDLPWREIHKRFPHYHYIEVQEQGLEGILEWKLKRKWNIYFYSTGKLDPNIPFSWLGIAPSHDSVIDVGSYINKSLLPSLKSFIPYERDDFYKNGWIFRRGEGGYHCAENESPKKPTWDGTFYVPIPSGCIPIVIDPRGLHEKSQTELSKKIWDIVKPTIQKRRKSDKPKKSQPIPQIGDRPELGFIYVTDDDIFNKHLRWYGLRMGQGLFRPEGLSFREIAEHDLSNLLNKKCPDKLWIIKKGGIKKLTKKEQKYIEEKTGEEIEWESAIEKAVKTIYKAIHEIDYPAKKRKDDCHCSIHGNWVNCPPNCKANTFNKRNRPLIGKKRSYAKAIESIADPHGLKPPTKSTQRKIIGLQKYISEEDE